MEFRICRAAEEHLPGITAIYNHAVLNSTATFDTEPKSLEDRRTWLAGHGEDLPILVALDEAGEVAGWASLSPYSDRLAYRHTVEDSIYLASRVQGLGLGKRLLGELLDLAAGVGHHSVVARIVAGNPASLALHEKLGFRTVGVLEEAGWKFDRWLDVFILQRKL